MILENKQTSKIIFFICLGVSLISFVSLIFPALLIESTISESNREIDLFEFGGWTIPIIFLNLCFLGFWIIHKLNKLPKIFKKIIHRIATYDISRKTAYVILLILFSIYFIFSIDELQREEFELGDYKAVEKHARDFKFQGILLDSTEVRYFILYLSILFFENIRILPFVGSIFLLLITFYLTLELTKKRISALIAFTVLLQSNLFLLFDTTSSYDNFWTLFYFISLYLIFKKPIGSHISFILGMLTKPLTITFFPINLFAIFTINTKKFTRIILGLTYGIVVILIIVAILTNNVTDASKLNFDFKKIISSMNEFGNALRYDGLILLLFIPTIIILFGKRGQIVNSINLIFVGIIISIFSQPIMYSVIDLTLQPYRFIPLIVFIAISIGMIFSNSNISDQK